MPTNDGQPSLRVVVDECVGLDSPLVRAFSQWLGDRRATWIELRERHPGIPDGAILEKVIQRGDILVTADCILHNRACADGIRSFTLNAQGDLTGKPLRDVPLRPRIAPAPRGELKETYVHVAHPITLQLRSTMSERDLKGYNTRRRRIRSLFGGQDNLGQVALTVGDLSTRRGLLCGFYLRVAGNGRKGLDATEGYCRDSIGTVSPALAPIRALMDVYLLDLEGIWTEAYLASEESFALCTRLKALETAPSEPMLAALHCLLQGIARLSLQPCRKGPIVEQLARKLGNLVSGPTNEVKTVDFAGVAASLGSRNEVG